MRSAWFSEPFFFFSDPNPAHSTSGGFSVSLRQVFNSVGEFSSSELLAVRGTSSRLLVVRWKNTVVPTLPPVPPGPLQMVALAVRLVGVWLVDRGVAVPMPPISRGRLFGVVSIWLLLMAVQFIFSGMSCGYVELTSQAAVMCWVFSGDGWCFTS